MHRMINKYSPKKLSDFEGRQDSLMQLKDFVENYGRGSLLLHGPPGSGKTAAVYALAKEIDYEVLELGASDCRKKEVLLQSIGNASQQMSLFNKGKLILIDDVDSLSSKDRGAVSAISSVIKESGWPVILTANDAMKDKIKDLKKKSTLVEMPPLSYLEIFNILKQICDKEKISYDENALKSLARQCGGDIRAAMTDLQVISMLGNSVTDTSLVAPRQQKEQVIDALKLVFKSTNPTNVLYAFDNVDIDFDTRKLWLEENIPKEYSGKSLVRAYDAMSKADVFKGRIMRRQHWRFLVYINSLLTAGVALAKDAKSSLVVNYKRSSRPLKYWLFNMRNARKKSIAEKIAPHLHVSKRNAFKDFIPLLITLFKVGDCSSLAATFGLDEEEVNYLRK